MSLSILELIVSHLLQYFLVDSLQGSGHDDLDVFRRKLFLYSQEGVGMSKLNHLESYCFTRSQLRFEIITGDANQPKCELFRVALQLLLASEHLPGVVMSSDASVLLKFFPQLDVNFCSQPLLLRHIIVIADREPMQSNDKLKCAAALR